MPDTYRRRLAKAKWAGIRKQQREVFRAEYIPAAQAEILQRIANTSTNVWRMLEEDPVMPSPDTVRGWLRANPDFKRAYDEALRARGDLLFEEALEIADDARNDWMARNDPNNPGWIANGEHIQRSKLRVETRKWMASKLRPERYGDKMLVEGNPDKPVVARIEHTIVDVVKPTETRPVETKVIDGDWDDA